MKVNAIPFPIIVATIASAVGASFSSQQVYEGSAHDRR
jgi:hypothetical protein